MMEIQYFNEVLGFFEWVNKFYRSYKRLYCFIWQRVRKQNMTILKNDLMLDDVPQPKLVRPKNLGRLILILSVLCLTTFYCGYCLAYIAALGIPNIIIVYGDLLDVPVIRAFLLASLPYGVMVGTYFSPWVIPLASRRNLTLILSLAAQILQLIIQIRSLPVFFIIRFSQGVVTGLFLALIPIYVRQISPKEINKKGVYGIFAQLFVIFGFMLSFGFNTIMLKGGLEQVIRWHIVVSVNFFAILIIIICILVKFLPQSPNSLIMKGQEEEAKKVIALFYRENFVEQIYTQKVKQVEDAKKPPPPPPKDRPIVKTILAFQIPIMHQFTGVNAYIAQMGFVTSTFNNSFGDYVPFLMGSVQVFTALYSITYLYRVNRRRMVLSGNFGMSLCCFGMGIGFLLINSYAHAFWISVTFLVIFMAIHGATLIPAVWTYVPEVATRQQIRWSQVVNWFMCANSIVMFVMVSAAFGYASIFFTFGTVTMICFIFNAIYMIETKVNIKNQVNIELGKLQLNSTSSEEKQELVLD